jgi:hypothetical protein
VVCRKVLENPMRRAELGSMSDDDLHALLALTVLAVGGVCVASGVLASIDNWIVQAIRDIF